jgi:hypothetical protein
MTENEYTKSDFNIDVPTIHIKTKSFEADAIELYELPHQHVLSIVAARGPQQMINMLAMFKLALVDQEKISNLDILSFNEMTEVVGQWASKSTAHWFQIGSSMEVTDGADSEEEIDDSDDNKNS